MESRHEIHAAVVASTGLIASTGNPDLVTFWRSAAKPFQAMPLAADGVTAAFGITEQELALTCASHSSEPGQVALVRAFLEKIGCHESDLLCGPLVPLSDAVAQDYKTRGVTLTAVHSNCSGKHTGMLALAKHHGWPISGYTAATHSVQQRCLAEISEWSGVRSEQIGTAIDGCGVLCYALPLRAMALAYAKLAAGAKRPASGAILGAMLAHPELVAGEGRPCTELMRTYPGRVVAKVGAEGVYSALLIEEGIGITLKVADGYTTAAALALGAILSELGLGPPPPALAARPITNSRGLVVGDMRVNGSLTR